MTTTAPSFTTVPVIHSKWQKKSLKSAFDAEEAAAELRLFLTQLINKPFCLELNSQSMTRCTCLSGLRHNGNADVDMSPTVDYLISFACRSRDDQQRIVMEWIKYSKLIGNGRPLEEKFHCFLLPGSTESYMLCKNALAQMIGLGRRKWETINNMVSNNTMPTHGLKGRPSNNTNPELYQDLGLFFDQLKEHAAPRATRFIRQQTGELDIRDDDVDLLELPTSMTKRSIFRRYVEDRGWMIKVDAKSRVVSKDPVEGEDQYKILSWASFLEYWSSEFPKLVIQKASEDICGESYVYANRFKYASELATRRHLTEVANGLVNHESSGSESDQSSQNERQEERDDIILKAAKHVAMAREQRQLVNRKVAESKQDVTDNRPRSERRITLICDFAQNLYLPNLASEQPGETYYYSPCNSYPFGIVDSSVPPDELTAYVYYEGDAKKGGNQVASMMMLDLQRRGYLDVDNPLKELNYVFDNCGGQNKNKMVLRQLLYLVHMGYAKAVNAIFLVRGHTKNPCDRMFNLLKKAYRKANCYTPVQLMDILNSQDQCEAVECEQEHFRDWEKLQNCFFRPMPSGNVKSNHIFSVSDDNPDVMKIQLYASSPVVEYLMVKRGSLNKDELAAAVPDELVPPGMPDIKWVELHDKWRPLVPREEHHKWKYFLNDPGPEVRQKVKTHSKKSRTDRKDRSRTVADD
jgi:hypothetical protein